MDEQIRLNELQAFLDDDEFPMDKSDAVRAFRDIDLVLADGTVRLGSVVEATAGGRYNDPQDLIDDIYTHLPRRAVGEPFQSEGDA